MNLKFEKSYHDINCFNKQINTIEFKNIEFVNCSLSDFTSLLFLHKDNGAMFFEKVHFYFNARHNKIEFSPNKIRINQQLNKLTLKFEELKPINNFTIILSYDIH